MVNHNGWLVLFWEVLTLSDIKFTWSFLDLTWSYILPMIFNEVPIMLYKVSKWLCLGFPWSLSCLCWAVVVYRLLPVFILFLLDCGYAQASRGLVLHLLGCGCPQTFPGLGLGFAGLWLCSYFPKSWSCLCWAMVMNRLPQVFVLILLGCGCACSKMF